MKLNRKDHIDIENLMRHAFRTESRIQEAWKAAGDDCRGYCPAHMAARRVVTAARDLYAAMDLIDLQD